MSRTRKNLVPWPEGTAMTLAGAAYARARNLDPETEWEKFEDYHRANGSVFADWDAAWRTWCRNAQKFAAERQPILAYPIGFAPAIEASLGRLPANVVTAMREEEDARMAVRQMDEAARRAAQQKFASLISQIGKKVPK